MTTDIKTDIKNLVHFESGHHGDIRGNLLKFHVMDFRCPYFTVLRQEAVPMRTFKKEAQNKNALKLT